MPALLVVEPLARHAALVPLVAQWFVSEWPQWYGPGGPGDVQHDLAAFAASEVTLPIGLIVFEDDQPVGAAALKRESIPSHTHLSPWAAAGYVLPGHRGRGIGAALLAGLLAQARQIGATPVYCGTRTADALLRRAGWSPIDTSVLGGQPLTIFASPGA